MKSVTDIQIRDPFILREGEWSYLFGTTDPEPWHSKGLGFQCFRSRDLARFEGPFPAFTPPEDFWADKNFWAPEVHKIGDAFYMFASFYREGCHRGTQILKADRPEGPYAPLTDGPYTPREWDCLDGTFFREDGRYYTVFAHEWLQAKAGTMELAELSGDLTHIVGQPVTLFRASDAPWARPINGSPDLFVTDGPFLHKLDCGRLAMIWSSFGEEGYALGAAYSDNGIRGPWVQEEKPLFTKDGGHGMIFRDGSGRRMLAIHAPNESPLERPVFLELREENRKIHLFQDKNGG